MFHEINRLRSVGAEHPVEKERKNRFKNSVALDATHSRTKKKIKKNFFSARGEEWITVLARITCVAQYML